MDRYEYCDNAIATLTQVSIKLTLLLLYFKVQTFLYKTNSRKNQRWKKT